MGPHGTRSGETNENENWYIIRLQVYPMGFGHGSAGLNGTGFQLMMIIFLELFGVTLGQLIAAISPSVQVSSDQMQSDYISDPV